MKVEEWSRKKVLRQKKKTMKQKKIPLYPFLTTGSIVLISCFWSIPPVDNAIK